MSSIAAEHPANPPTQVPDPAGVAAIPGIVETPVAATSPRSTTTPGSTRTGSRIASIDLLRGIIMVIMALDHVRDYFHADAFVYDPTDLQKTTVFLFLTRWITHYCAPTFMFLAGLSASLIGIRKSKKELSSFLFKRGLWLVFLEFTVVRVAWSFNIHISDLLLVVIWALGACMILLSVLIWLPKKSLLITGLLLVVGHNLLDTVHVAGEGGPHLLWAVIHERHLFLAHGFLIMVGYPLVPWVGVMALGYAFGTLYHPSFPAGRRKKILLYLGSGMTLLFILLRWSNVYGDARPWVAQSSGAATLLSFLNVTKYPPSLLYLLMTLGPGILFLAVSENAGGWLSRKLSVFGRVPMFYYILHLYLLHLLAVLAAPLCGHKGSDMIVSQGWVDFQPQLKGFGFSLGVVYAVWIFVVLCLYPLCEVYDRYKREHKEKWWLSYL